MGNEKKAVTSKLLGRSIFYSALSVWAIIGSLFMLYFGIIFTGMTLGGISSGEFSGFTAFMALILLFLGLGTIHLGFKNGQQLWAPWQRRLAIAEEQKRVLRLPHEEKNTRYLCS